MEGKIKMKKKTIKILYYSAWAVGIFAAALLFYGIIISLIEMLS